jgi:hypothetical protein
LNEDKDQGEKKDDKTDESNKGSGKHYSTPIVTQSRRLSTRISPAFPYPPRRSILSADLTLRK